MAEQISSIFTGLKQSRDVTTDGTSKYSLMRGVMDFGNLAQWEMYETGYAFLKIVKTPDFLEKLAERNTEYRNLLTTYKRIVEFEFRQINGIPNIGTDPLSITNNISTIELIGKTTFDSNITFSMPYFERSGAPLTKLHELYLRGIKDPKTTYKHYNGLLEDNPDYVPGYEKETFTFLVGFTDNTGLKLERAFLLLGVQPTEANFSELYEYTKGTIENKELSLEYRGYLVTGKEVNTRAEKVLKYLNTPGTVDYIHKDESKFVYSNMDVIDASIG